MLRITVHDKPEALTFQLEGRLAGPWVRVLQECWRDAGARRCWRSVQVDLSEVTAIDAAGRAYLSSLHGQGVAFVAADCLTKEIVAEITRGRQLVEDPVAKILLPKHLASSTLERDGKTYYFVDEDTRREFEQQPPAPTKEVQS